MRTTLQPEFVNHVQRELTSKNSQSSALVAPRAALRAQVNTRVSLAPLAGLISMVSAYVLAEP